MVVSPCAGRGFALGAWFVRGWWTRQGREPAPPALPDELPADEAGGGHAVRRARFDNSLMRFDASLRVSAPGFRLNARRLIASTSAGPRPFARPSLRIASS